MIICWPIIHFHYKHPINRRKQTKNPIHIMQKGTDWGKQTVPERNANFFFRMGNITDASILLQLISTALKHKKLKSPSRENQLQHFTRKHTGQSTFRKYRTPKSQIRSLHIINSKHCKKQGKNKYLHEKCIRW